MAPAVIEAALLRASTILLGLWGVLNAVQWFADSGRWHDRGALGWDLLRLRKGRIYRSRLLGKLYAPAGLRVLATSLLAASVALILTPPAAAPAQAVACLTLFLLATTSLALRAGPDGADKIAMVTATGLLLQVAGFGSSTPELLLAGVLWVGGQLSIAYFTSGASKLLLAPWRSGEALRGALSSYMFGSQASAALVARQRLLPGLAWTIMLTEALFPLALVGPPWLLYLTLAAFFLFHIAVALVMGLNTYPWAFLAAYPSVVMLSRWLRTTFGFG